MYSLFDSIVEVFNQLLADNLLIDRIISGLEDISLELVNLDLHLAHTQVGLFKDSLEAVEVALALLLNLAQLVLELVDLARDNVELLIGVELHAKVALSTARLGAFPVARAAATSATCYAALWPALTTRRAYICQVVHRTRWRCC